MATPVVWLTRLLWGVSLLLLVGLPRQAQQPPWACLPPAVTDLRVNVVNGEATLYWTLPRRRAALPLPKVRALPVPQTAPLITGWQYSPNDGQDWYDIPGSDADTRSHRVRGLTPGQTYRFRVRALNRYGAGPASNPQRLTVSVPPTATARPRSGTPVGLLALGPTPTPPPTNTPGPSPTPTITPTPSLTPTPVPTNTPAAVPGAVTDLAASAGPGSETVTLTWSTPSGVVTSWEYWHSHTRNRRGGWSDIPNSDGTTTSHVISGLRPQLQQSFEVRAKNSRGTAPTSNRASAIPN